MKKTMTIRISQKAYKEILNRSSKESVKQGKKVSIMEIIEEVLFR